MISIPVIIEEILLIIAKEPPLAQIRFLISGNYRLSGDTPIYRLCK